MNYLLVNHVPIGRSTSPNRFVIGDMWLEDLLMQAKAWQPYGKLALSVPCVDDLKVSSSGSFNLVEFAPAEVGFEVFPLPYYNSTKTLIQVLPKLRQQLELACHWASVVQADYGGHPVALGQLVWSTAGKHDKKRIWVFDGADPFPRLERSALEEPNLFKQLMKKTWLKRFERFCRNAIQEADLVFTHNASVTKRFEQVWGEQCYSFDRSFVTQQILISDEHAALRQKRLLDAQQPLKLVAVGRQIPIKATDHLLQAIARAISNGANLKLDVIGDGEALENYKQLAEKLGIANRVSFSGTLPYGEPLFAALERSDVIVITNLTAEISRNVLLGMARGLPLITYRNPGTDALIEEHQAGILVPNGDINALSEALLTADRNRQHLAELVTNGLLLAQTKTLEKTHRQRAELAAGKPH